MKSKWMGVFLFYSVFLFCLCVNPAEAVLLVDNNSTANIDPGSYMGEDDWYCDGTNNLFQQWFWYRIGDTGPEASIDTISAPLVSVVNADFDPGDETLHLRYENNTMRVDVSIELVGGAPGSGVSDLMEGITITNLTGTALDLHFFQYVDFDLAGTISNDKVVLQYPNTFVQTDEVSDMWVSETVVVPTATRYEANIYAATLNALQDGDADNLANIPSAGIGDATWAFQWDVELLPGDSFIISKDKHIDLVPEPITLALLGLGGLILRRKK